MTDLDLHEGMEAVAAEAPAPPADLLGRIEKGRRRHRRNQAVTAAFAAVVLLSGGVWAATRPAVRHQETPVTPAPAASFRIPSSVANPPLVSETWPRSMIGAEEPLSAPDGDRIHLIDRLDQDNVLMAGEDTFYAWSPRDRKLRTLVDGTGMGRQGVLNRAMVTPKWIVWARLGTGIPEHYRIFRAPRQGGDPQEVGRIDTVHQSIELLATDDHAYLLRHPDREAVRMSLDDGVVTTVPGSRGFDTTGTFWGHRYYNPGDPGFDPDQGPFVPSVYRNLLTGEEFRPKGPPGVEGVRCQPAVCLARSTTEPRRWFVSRPDGTQLTELPYPGVPQFAGTTAGGRTTLLMVDSDVLLDPFTGKFGVVTREPAGGCRVAYSPIKDVVAYRWAADAACADRRVAYIDVGH